MEIPQFCNGCGKPYPWTERSINAAVELMTEEAKLDQDEAQKFEQTIKDLATDTPLTAVAIMRFKKLLPRVAEGSVQLIQGLMVKVVTDVVFKKMFPQ
jgi:hypothetical protein